MRFSKAKVRQKCALEVHDAEQRQLKNAKRANKRMIGLTGALQAPELVSVFCRYPSSCALLTCRKAANLSPAAVDDTTSPGKRSVNRGDVDLAIRSMRASARMTRRRPAPNRPLSKIFMDGGSVTRGRLIES